MLDLPCFGIDEGPSESFTKLEDLLKAIKNLEEEIGSSVSQSQVPPKGTCDGLCAYIEANDAEGIRATLIEEPLLILTPNSSGRYPLHVAVCAGSCEGTELLLCFGASVNAMDEQGHTALDCAEALHCAAGETIKGMLKKRGAERHHIRGSDDDLTLSGISGGGTPPQGLSFASCQWNDFGLTSHTRDADMSEPLEMPSMHSGLDTSITDEGDIDEVITLPPPTTPPANPEPVFFVDPNSRNTLEFSVERGELSYTVKDTRRPPIQKIEFCPGPPRLMFPNIGTCATLPDTGLGEVLAGIRSLAMSAGVPHDIPSAIHKRRETVHWNSDKSNLVIVMIGLPGRGKTFIAQRLCRWLNWKGVRARIFSADKGGDGKAVQSLVRFLEDTPGAVGVLGATRCCVEDRQQLVQQVAKVASQERVVFIDAASNDPELIRVNVCGAVELEKEEEERLMQAHAEREARQLRRHQTLTEATDGELSWVQIATTMNHNEGAKVSINKVTGHLCQKLLFFLFNLHPTNTTTYLVRTGECLHQIANKVGGDSELTSKGWQHAAAVRRFFNLPEHRHKHMQVFCSRMKRAIETQSCFQGSRFTPVQYKTLNEINAAECDGLTPEEIKQRFPSLWRKRATDKYFYGWPRGESYSNMNQRLEQVILDIHRSTLPVLIIGHLDVCRGLYAYLSEMLPELCVYLTLPQHAIYEFNYNTTKHALSIKVHDISAYVTEAMDKGVSSSRPPSRDYLRSAPDAPPARLNPPQLPAHVTDIMSEGGTCHSRSLSGTFPDSVLPTSPVHRSPPPRKRNSGAV